MGAPEAIALLNRCTGRSYQLIGRLAGGETGAHAVVDPDGVRRVCKWALDPAARRARGTAVALTERLRLVAGWPVPGQEVIAHESCLFVLSDFMEGQPIVELTHSLVDTVCALHEHRLGLAHPDDPVEWVTHLRQTLTVGGQHYCRHDSLRHYDARTAALLERIRAIGHQIAPAAFSADDVVHWDLHPGNALQDSGRLSAIVDTDFVKVGDGAFDLATMAVASLALPCRQGVRDRLFQVGLQPLSEDRRQAYVGHLLLRFLDWPIRRGAAPEVDRWLGAADRLLED